MPYATRLSVQEVWSSSFHMVSYMIFVKSDLYQKYMMNLRNKLSDNYYNETEMFDVYKSELLFVVVSFPNLTCTIKNSFHILRQQLCTMHESSIISSRTSTREWLSSRCMA